MSTTSQVGNFRELTPEERRDHPDTADVVVIGAVCTSVDPESWLACHKPRKAKPLTQEQFIAKYCQDSGMSWDDIRQYKVCLPCNCGTSDCTGWVMIADDQELIRDHQQACAERKTGEPDDDYLLRNGVITQDEWLSRRTQSG